MLELQAGGIENDWKTSKFLISSIKGIRTPRHIDNNVDYSKYFQVDKLITHFRRLKVNLNKFRFGAYCDTTAKINETISRVNISRFDFK